LTLAIQAKDRAGKSIGNAYTEQLPCDVRQSMDKIRGSGCYLAKRRVNGGSGNEIELDCR
tara:strand:+ start:164 stop:343 length:180 start_codon:yes stop_codon:yes gene_type:complete